LISWSKFGLSPKFRLTNFSISIIYLCMPNNGPVQIRPNFGLNDRSIQTLVSAIAESKQKILHFLTDLRSQYEFRTQRQSQQKTDPKSEMSVLCVVGNAKFTYFFVNLWFIHKSQISIYVVRCKQKQLYCIDLSVFCDKMGKKRFPQQDWRGKG